MEAIRATLRKWKGPPKEPEVQFIGKIDRYDDTPRPAGTRGRPRKKGRVSKKVAKKRMQWRKASTRYYNNYTEEILLKSASQKKTHRHPLYRLIFGV